MSDQPPGQVPPPPPQQPPPPAYQPPPPAGYQAPPALPTAPPPAGAAGILRQFTGVAGWSCVAGIATIVVPLVFNYVFYYLAVIGLILGIVAVVRKQYIGGVTGIVLNVIGGLITFLLLTSK